MQEFLIVLALMLANGVFAGAEIAVLSVRRTRLSELAESGSRAVRAIVALRANPEKFLATVQIGITVVGTTAAAYGGAHLTTTFADFIRLVPFLSPYADSIGVTLVVAMISFLELVFGELVPKSIALRSAEAYSRVVARPLLFLSVLASPVVALLTASSNLVLRAFGDKTNFTEARISPEELRLLVDEASKSGALDPRTGEIASRAIDFGELTAYECMVPRGAVIGLPRYASNDVIRRVLLEDNHSRVPVFEGTIDQIIGYVTAKDVLAMVLQKDLIVLEDLIRPAYFVPETMPAIDLLQEMQVRRTPLAIVVDELGSVTGIVTTEDLVEELVGEIFSEHDKVPEDLFVREPSGATRVQGALSIRDANRLLALDLPEGDNWSTVAGLCIALAGKIPGVGLKVTVEGGRVLEVVDATARRIRFVRVYPLDGPIEGPG